MTTPATDTLNGAIDAVAGNPVIVFDTSVVNHLFDDPQRERLLVSLAETRHVYLGFIVADELFATRSPERRKALLGLCCDLVEPDGSHLLMPDDEMLKHMIEQFDTTRAIYPMQSLRALKNFREAIASEEITGDDATSAQARVFNREKREQFERAITEVKGKFFSAFSDLSGDPVETVSRLEDGGHVRALARSLYEKVAVNPINDEELDWFLEHCPPFKALLIAIAVAQHERFVGHRFAECSKKPAGQSDLYQALLLPYCHEFCMQDNPFREAFSTIVRILNYQTRILSYGDLRAELLEA